MKKFFAILGISALTFCASLGLPRQSVSVAYAENESSEQVNSSESSQTSSENENESSEEEYVIDVDKEISSISQTAKDTIEVIKTVLNQPIVIGGTTFTLGMLVVWLFGKVIIKVIDKRSSKQDKKIEECLKKIGLTQEQIDWLKENIDKLSEIIKEMINNTKNIQVKDKLLGLYNGKNEQEQVEIENVEPQETKPSESDKIKELLEK